MVVIRLARAGRNKYPVYRIVAAESARAATGKFVAILGHYNPHTKELVIKHEETLRFLGHGAQPSNTVVKLLMREKLELPKWVKLKTKVAKPVEAEAEAEAKAVPVEPEVEETPAETEVTEAEVAAEAADLDVTEEAEVADNAEASDEEPDETLAEKGPRVAAVATENEAEAEADVTDKNTTETAENSPKA